MTLQLSGQRFGKLTVTAQVKSEVRRDRKRRFWLCRCDCGSKSWVEASNLAGGNSTSCVRCCKIKHGHAAGDHQTRTYKSWANMLTRCTNKNFTGYKDYGGRGITVCKRWLDFDNFLADMGEAPARKTIERKDNDKNYTPKNCCWATPKEQGQNRRSTRLSFAKADEIRLLSGKGVSKAEIARKFKVSFSAICRVVDGTRWNREVGVK